MGDRSTIEWTDATWNPVVGCERVSPGCGDETGGGCDAQRRRTGTQAARHALGVATCGGGPRSKTDPTPGPCIPQHQPAYAGVVDEGGWTCSSTGPGLSATAASPPASPSSSSSGARGRRVDHRSTASASTRRGRPPSTSRAIRSDFEPEPPVDIAVMTRVGKHRGGRALDGRTWDEIPPTTSHPRRER